MGEDASYLFRGTTRGWAGNDNLIQECMTCATIDPLVATLFAIECRNHGEAVVIIVPRKPFENMIGASNWFELEECAVNLSIEPLGFAEHATAVLDVERAIGIPTQMGFHQLPARLTHKTALDDALEETHASGQRLSPSQVAEFIRRALEGRDDQ
jgi:hypothetical protein